MFHKKDEKTAVNGNVPGQEKPTPAYLRGDYPYKAVGEAITDLENLEQTGVLYEIRCTKCETSVRSQGSSVKAVYARLSGNGCIVCGGKEFVVKKVDTAEAEKA